mgnify:CR=1 FL=1
MPVRTGAEFIAGLRESHPAIYIHGERVEDSSQLVPALRNALAAVNEGRIALVDVVLDI